MKGQRYKTVACEGKVSDGKGEGMLYSQLQKEIKQHILHPVYLLYGEERFVLLRTLERLIQAALDGADADWNLVRFDAAARAEDIVLSAQTLGLFAANRVIVVQDCPAFYPGCKESEEKQLLALVQDLPEQVTLIFVCRKKPDGRKPLTKALQKQITVDFAPLAEPDIHAWLRGYAKQNGLSWQPEAMERLLFYVGRDMQTIVSETDKVFAYAYPHTDITPAMVETIVTQSTEAKTFDIVDDLFSGHLAQAQMQIDLLLRNGESIPALIGAIVYRIRTVLEARQWLEQGLSVKSAAAKLKGPRFATERTARLAQKWPLPRLERALCALAEADFSFKSGQMRDRTALDTALARAFKHEEII